MRPVLRSIAALSTALVLAACSGNGSTATTAPGGGSAPCTDSTGATTVAATVANSTWSQPVTAKVGDVITWTNSDSIPHKVALDDGSCGMSANIDGGGSKSLTFSKAGSYAFHCAIHSSMKGTITIS